MPRDDALEVFEAATFKFTYLARPLNRYTFKAPKVRAWVEQYCKGLVVLNLFAGPTRLSGCIEYSNDLDPNFATTFHLDALDCVNLLRSNLERKFDRIVIDPPYSYRKSMELYHGNKNSRFKKILDLIPEILTPKGLVITFGYHSNVMSKKRGFAIREILLISHGGAQHDTIVSVEERIKVTEKEIIT